MNENGQPIPAPRPIIHLSKGEPIPKVHPQSYVQ